jgi:hypothetical protein
MVKVQKETCKVLNGSKATDRELFDTSQLCQRQHHKNVTI